MSIIQAKQLDTQALPLRRAYDRPACTDIAIIGLDKVSNGIARFRTGWAFAAPPGYHIELYVRSSTPSTHGWVLANSVAIIDNDYRGEIRILLQLNSQESYLIYDMFKEKAENLAHSRRIHMSDAMDEILSLWIEENFPYGEYMVQFSLVKTEPFQIVQVDELSTTSRGSQGIGSSY